MHDSQLPWLDAAWKHLVDLRRDQRLPHALLFHGPSGVGKGLFSERFAHFLLCDQPNEYTSCGQCKSCLLNKAGTHPDFYQLSPPEKSVNIKVDQIRGLGDFIYSSAQQGGYRVVVIEPADTMNIASANALLKMLEEPGKDTLLMLITNRLGQLMPTIKSRCQRVECPLPSREQGLKWLAQQSVDEDQASLLLDVCHGAPLRALDYQKGDLGSLRTMLLEGLADAIKGRRSPLALAETWQKQNLELLLGWLYGVVLDIARVNQKMQDTPKNADCANMVLAIARRCQPQALFEFADLVLQHRQSIMLNHNVNKQLMLETLLIEWSKITLSGR